MFITIRFNVLNLLNSLVDKYNHFKLNYFPDELPSCAHIEITNTCNLKCIMCDYTNMTRAKGIMSFETYQLALKQCKEAGIAVIKLYTVSEPLLHKDLEKFIVYAKNKGFYVEISTNALLLDEQKAKSILETEVDSILISFSGYDKESYESVYLGGKYEKVIQNIKFLQSCALNNNFKTLITVVGTNLDNEFFAQNTEKTKQMLGRIGIHSNHVYIRPAQNFGGAANFSSQTVINNIRTIKDAENIKPKKIKMCPILVNKIGVLHNGDITACGCFDTDGKMVIGNIYNNGIVGARRSQEYLSILQKFKDKDLKGLSMCEQCDSPYY